MTINHPNNKLETDEIIDLISKQDHISNSDEIAVGTNDIIDQKMYMPGDKELVTDIADDIGLVDSRPADDIIAQMVNAIDYTEEEEN